MSSPALYLAAVLSVEPYATPSTVALHVSLGVPSMVYSKSWNLTILNLLLSLASIAFPTALLYSVRKSSSRSTSASRWLASLSCWRKSLMRFSASLMAASFAFNTLSSAILFCSSSIFCCRCSSSWLGVASGMLSSSRCSALSCLSFFSAASMCCSSVWRAFSWLLSELIESFTSSSLAAAASMRCSWASAASRLALSSCPLRWFSASFCAFCALKLASISATLFSTWSGSKGRLQHGHRRSLGSISKVSSLMLCHSSTSFSRFSLYTRKSSLTIGRWFTSYCSVSRSWSSLAACCAALKVSSS